MYCKRPSEPLGASDMAVDLRGHPMFPPTGINTPARFEADVFPVLFDPPHHCRNPLPEPHVAAGASASRE
jgi:hypothetical protein